MTTGVACATEFWDLVEVQTKCIIPTYLKNLLKLCGYDNALSVKSVTDDDIKSLESFARTKMRMFIPTGANYKDYYDMFSAQPECFEILPGHVKMLKAIANRIDVIQESAPTAPSVSTTCSELDYSNQENDQQQLVHSRNDDRGNFSEHTQCNGTSQTAAIHILQEEPFKAFIVDGSPEHFFIQLESIQGELDRMEDLLTPASTWAVFNKVLVGKMCAASFDGRYYRGIILSSDEKGATIHYVDYGNKAISTDLRKLPDDLLRHRHLAIDCRLASKDGTFSPQLIGRFENLSRDNAYEMKFVDKESRPAIVELFVDGKLFEENQKTTNSVNVPECNGFEKQFDDIAESNKKFDEILDQMSELVLKNMPSIQQDQTESLRREMPKFSNPTTLQDGDYVVIRYVESPTLFSVQQTKSIADYDVMMDRLCDYSSAAPTIRQPQIGMACVAFYNSDSEWYRAEILDVGTDDALTRFVDYGIELTIQINQLKEIGNEFLLMPKQAIPCCILGFESLKATKTVTDKLEFLAETSSGDRRKFRVTTHGIVNGTALVNLVDEKDSPVLDLSMRLLQLSLPQEKFREYRKQALQESKPTSPQSTSAVRPDCGAISPLNTKCASQSTSPVKPISDCAAISYSQISPLPRDDGSTMQGVEMQRLVGQTVMAKIASFKDQNCFQIVVIGCEITFEASCHSVTSSTKNFDKYLPKGVTIPFRIESLLVRKIFSVTPLVDGTSSSLICNFPFFSNNFEVYVIHWEQYNVAYVQSLTALGLVESLLNELFDFYDKSDNHHQEYDTIDDDQEMFALGALRAVKSSDENWYRAEIINETQAEVNVRYLDYGNCEVIPKSLVKRLDSKFLNIPALAVKVYLPLQKVYSDRETSVDEVVKLTAGARLHLRVLDSCDRNWIVDMLMDNVSITVNIKQKNCCKSMSIDELKKQIAQCETLQKVARLQAQKERENLKVKTTPTITSNVHKDAASAISRNALPASELNHQQVNDQQTFKTHVNGQQTSKTIAYISHVNRPDQFYLQFSSITSALDQLSKDIQIVAPARPLLKDFSIGTRCFVRYSLDDQWYRAAIIDLSSGITTILFIDFGNTASITNNSLIKSMSDAFDRIPPFAIPCSLPLEPKDRMDWSEEACELLKNLVDKELEFEYVCKGKANNFVKLYHEDRDIMQELIWAGCAIKIESIKTGTACHVSHVNSMLDFYIQMETDIDTQRKVANYLLNASKFDIMKNIKKGVICAARDPNDKLWYRAKILSFKGNSTEVFFLDNGHSTMTNDLRALPASVAVAPALAKNCSLLKPNDDQHWSERAEQVFIDLTDNGSIFIVDVVDPGKRSTVDLLVEDMSILDEISAICDKPSPNQLQTTLQTNDSGAARSEIFNAFIIIGSPSKFYIQLESDSNQLDKMWYALEKAYLWRPLKKVIVGQMCAALFDGNYYRAMVLSLNAEGALVHYVDYGNQSPSNDLRELPEDLQQHKHLAICCCLESQYGTVSSQMIERFEKLSRDDTYGIRFVSKDSSRSVVELFVQGKKF